MVRLGNGNGDASVFRWKQVERVQRHGPLQTGRVWLTGKTELGDRTFLEGQHGIVHRDIKELTLADIAGMVNRRDDAKCHQRAGEDICDGRGHQTVIGMHQAAKTLRRRIERRPVRIRTFARPRITETAHAGIDDLRVPLRNDLVADTQSIHDTGPHVFNHGVSLIAEFKENFLVLGLFQIEDYTALVTVHCRKRCTEISPCLTVFVGAGVVRQKRRDIAIAITRRRLNFDDPGPKVSQKTRTEWPRQCPGAVNDGQVLQWT